MLTKIFCDKFSPEHQSIQFNPGLNTILGNSVGSNAIGKSTFLWIIDYVFGGNSYYSINEDIKEEVGPHRIYFTFEFDEHPYYFYRDTDTPNYVHQIDHQYHIIKKLTIDEYKNFLYTEYKIGLPHLEFDEITTRFYRIYGRENTLEKHPLLVKAREKDELAVNFLMKLFGHNDILSSIKNMEEELGVKSNQLKSRETENSNKDKIESNKQIIQSLKERLKRLMKDNEEAQLSMFGFDTKAFERITSIQKELRNFTHQRNKLQSQVNAIKNNIRNNDFSTSSEFKELEQFFPEINIKAFEEIEMFHVKIREILEEEMDEEIERLKPIISEFDFEINRLNKKIKESGFAKEMSERVLSQCVNISKSIDKLEEETAELIHQNKLKENRANALTKLENLILIQTEILNETQALINNQLIEINDEVTKQQETAPVLKITPGKDIFFETPGNTSEGTAYKSLVVYDLSIFELRPIPALIHDSNILKRIEDIHLEKILERYHSTNRQVFIAFDKASSATENARNILDETAILRLSEGNELFGRSWSRHKFNN